MGQNIKSKTRSSKVLLVSLSLAAGLSGWAWLTLTQTQADAQAELYETDEIIVETVSNPARLQVNAYAAGVIAQPPRPSIPNLAQLPVRGLREVGDYVPPPPQTQGQPPAVGQRNQGGGGQSVSQSQSDPQPQPKPKPKRKAKSSK